MSLPDPSRYSLICRILVLGFVSWSLATSARADSDKVSVDTGSIESALYAVARPPGWNGKLLIFAHGYIPETEPLKAPLDPGRPLYAELLGRGWMIATSSYRRNGVIIQDAVEDLGLLRAHIAERYGEPRRVLVMGDSMGGVIATLMAEKFQDRYDGVLAVGAALNRVDTGEPGGFSHDPHVPIVFLTNQDELEGPEDYVFWAEDATVPPALWRVGRDGHVNVNARERLAALKALERFIDTGEWARSRDGTIDQSADSTASIHGRTAESEVIALSPEHGNIFTGLVAADLDRLGIHAGDRFQMTIRETTVSVLMGSSYGDVERGEWVGIMRAEGVLMVARNFENACETVGCEPGDRIVITAQ